MDANSAAGDMTATITGHSDDDVGAALAVARGLPGPDWSADPIARRLWVLSRVAYLMEEHCNELARVIVHQLRERPPAASTDVATHPPQLRVEKGPRTFVFGPFMLIPERQLLLNGEAPVRIGSRALEILTVLVERAGELVCKRDLFARVWPDTFVEEGNLKVNVAGLRRALGEAPGQTRYIAAVPGRGYRFVAPVRTHRREHDPGDVDDAPGVRYLSDRFFDALCVLAQAGRRTRSSDGPARETDTPREAGSVISPGRPLL
jgi:DNA-binding winged helix-turn-helix (wHTH) protein